MDALKNMETPSLFDGNTACSDKDPDIFFPEDEEDRIQSLLAKSICSTCAVQSQCLTLALDERLEGIWGGTTTEERRKLRRKMRSSEINTRATA